LTRGVIILFSARCSSRSVALVFVWLKFKQEKNRTVKNLIIYRGEILPKKADHHLRRALAVEVLMQGPGDY